MKLRIMLLLAMVFTHYSFAEIEARSYPSIYPFVPYQVEKIYNKIAAITEDSNFVKNIFDATDQNLDRGHTEMQPWTSTYWPLNRGLIADPYETTLLGYYLERGSISWSANYNTFSARKNSILKNIDKLSEGQLIGLAPSEKYDLLLGDKTFDLTNRLWDYQQKWGNYKENAFITKIFLIGEDALTMAQDMVAKGWFENTNEAFAKAYQLRGSIAVDEALRLVKAGEYNTVDDAMPEAMDYAIEESNNYVKEKKNNLIAFWEGICHGWATSAGIVPRPRRSVDFKLPDGRNLRFFPADIKALVSLLWANSLIQDNKNIDSKTGKNIGGGVINAGLRCNLEKVARDNYGRLYDQYPDPFNGDHSPRCSGVHPAIWHMSLINLIGKQKRSFIVERKVGHEVDNHPMYQYKLEYFNPNNGNENRKLENNIERIDSDDQFQKYRSSKAKFIIGVKTTMTYLDWKRPQRYITDDESRDKLNAKEMLYDLELDENYNIVGGQWRAVKVGKPKINRPRRNGAPRRDKLNHNQPDFFWVITKDWKPFFKEVDDLETWKDKSLAPPASWLEEAKSAHAFIYHKKYSYGTGQKCRMYNTRTRRFREVSCEMEEPRPQPLVNLVNVLVERSK